MIIPKYPKVPDLSDNQIDEMTKIVFGEDNKLISSYIIIYQIVGGMNNV